MNKKLLVAILMMDVSFEPTEIEKIETANRCYARIVSNFQKLQEEHPELEIKIATMTIGKHVYWHIKPTEVGKCKIKHFEAEGGIADFKTAFSELNDKLRRNQFMAYSGKIAALHIVLVANTLPFTNCKDEIEMLLNNGWFCNANRTVGLIGEPMTNFDKDVCKPFVNDAENIFRKESEIQDFKVVVLGPGTGTPHNINQPIISGGDDLFFFEDENPFTEKYDENPWATISDNDEGIWL